MARHCEHTTKKHKRLRSVGHAETPTRARVRVCVCVYIWRFAFRLTQVIFFLPSLSRALSPLSSLLTLLSQFFFFSLSNCVKSDSMSLSLSVAFYEFRFICTKRKRKKKSLSEYFDWIELDLDCIRRANNRPPNLAGTVRTVHLVLFSARRNSSVSSIEKTKKENS